jgi:hypothetical protein
MAERMHPSSWHAGMTAERSENSHALAGGKWIRIILAMRNFEGAL